MIQIFTIFRQPSQKILVRCFCSSFSEVSLENFGIPNLLYVYCPPLFFSNLLPFQSQSPHLFCLIDCFSVSYILFVIVCSFISLTISLLLSLSFSTFLTLSLSLFVSLSLLHSLCHSLLLYPSYILFVIVCFSTPLAQSLSWSDSLPLLHSLCNIPLLYLS